MLPFDLPWYRRLIGLAVGIGAAGGVLGLIYLGSTGAVIGWLFGDAGTALWSGSWQWIPLLSIGGLVVAALRKAWHVPKKVPGGVEIIEAGEVNHKTAPQWVVITAISAMAGASLGPSLALVIMGGALGSWIAERRWAEGRANQDYTLTGIAGGLGAAFTAPILGAFLVSELGPTPRTRYVAAIIPQLISASFGFLIFYLVVGRTFLGSYDLPPYEFEVADMITAVVLGVLAAIIMAVLVAVVVAVKQVTQLVTNSYILGTVGGAAVGLIAVALPLTLGAGQSQLDTVIENASVLGVGLLLAVLVGKMVAMSLSLAVGFMGGNVFPMIFIGGTAGVIVHVIFPDVPYALAVSCMMAAVPGSFLRAPVSMTMIAVVAISLGAEGIAPVAMAVVTAYLLVAVARYLITQRREQVAGAEISAGEA